jgi:hypothetical protein
MAKASLGFDTAVQASSGQRGSSPPVSALDRARLNIADKIDELSLATAIGRHQRGEDFGAQLAILAANRERRLAILGGIG